jgi:hypothetical protein
MTAKNQDNWLIKKEDTFLQSDTTIQQAIRH